MADIRGIAGLAREEIDAELRQGARFVQYRYCVSFVALTFVPHSAIYFVRRGQDARLKGLLYSAVSGLLGWWGIPWGPYCTMASIAINTRGGKDVTEQAVATLHGEAESTPSSRATSAG